jgi:acyl-CoA thioester hydrolase
MEDDDTLGRWPVTVLIAVAWGDMDPLCHVNNTVYLRWFESARIAYFDRIGLLGPMNARQVGPILARQEIDYRRATTYPDTVRVDTTVTSIGTTSFTMGFRIAKKDTRELLAEGSGVMVLYDYRTNRKVPIDNRLRLAIAAVEATGGSQPG